MKGSGRALSLLSCCALLAGCPGDPPVEPVARQWHVEVEHLGGAILSFWGSSPSDVFAAGGPISLDGGRALILHHDGSSWTEMEAPGTTLWWVYGLGPSDVWAVGERGVILHYDGATWSQVVAPEHPYTLWGVWGARPDDLWAVGGVVSGGEPSVVRHYDGLAWTDVAGVGRDGELLFKVWGTDSEHVWIVGTRGAVIHWDGASWTRVESGTTDRLLTVRGRDANDVYAVGGLASPRAIHWDGTRWSDLAIQTSGGLMGVWTDTGGPVAISGARGILIADDGLGWAEPPTPPTELCLHAVWGDGTGRLYAGGGDLFSGTDPEGLVLASDPP